MTKYTILSTLATTVYINSICIAKRIWEIPWVSPNAVSGAGRGRQAGTRALHEQIKQFFEEMTKYIF